MEEKIRLAVFGQKRLSREGGIEIVVKELCTRMAQNGCDVTCYNRAGHHVSGAEYDKTIEYDGIRQKVVPTIEKKGLAAVSSSFFAALCSAFGRYDVVHIHAEGPAFFCWIPKLFGKRVISTIHGLDWAREKWRGSVASKFIRGGEKNAVKYADEIIVLSKGVQKYFMDTYGRETHFIPNGVNRPEVREAKLITDNFGLKKDSYILFLGRLVPEKGIRYLVEAFKNVKTDKKLVIAGGSSDTDSFMEELKELAKGDDRILFTGFVQGAMLDELYSNAYIYTLPSDLEGMPLSLLEAMSYGNCCLVSDIPECAEVVEDKALIFKKSDVEDLREKLQEVCDHPEMVMKMKNQAADFICEKYNWDEVVKETMNCKRDFTYVDDIVEGVVRVMKKAPDKKNGEDGLPIPPYAVYNIGNQNPENLLDFVQILSEELVRAKVLPEDYDFEAHKELVPMQPGDVPVTYADTSALERDFGYKPSTSLRTGLRNFAEWYAEFYK